MSVLEDQLLQFAKEHRIAGKGPLSVMLVVTRLALDEGLPLHPEELLTEAGGQVAGLGGGAVQAILRDHGIGRVLAQEGGRTSRGSIDKMRRYVALLNDLHVAGFADLPAIERWWIERVREHFASRPFKLRLDASKSLRAIVRDLLDQALDREREMHGTRFAGAVLQHLVGAKLALALPDHEIDHHGATVADSPTNRGGDFLLGDVAIHVTTAPTEALVQKCFRNLEHGLRPLIVTIGRGSALAEGLLLNAGLEGRVDVFEAEQFVATNVYELSRFSADERRVTVEQLLDQYNAIVSACETDPSLRITLGS